MVSLTDLRIFSVRHLTSVVKKNYEPRIAPDRVSSGPTSFTGSVAMDFMPEHAPIDPIEEKLRAFRCKTTENRWVGYNTNTLQTASQVPSHGVCPLVSRRRTSGRRAHEPSAFLHLNAGILPLSGRLEHTRTQNPSPPTR